MLRLCSLNCQESVIVDISGLYTGFLPSFCELEYVKRGGMRLFVAAGQPQGGGCVWKFKGERE